MLFTSITCLLVLSLSLASYGFNLDLERALIFSPPKGSESKYFGYSVALHSFNDKYWAIVGAPLSNVSSRSSAERFIRYGEVYRCEYTGSQSCSSIDIDNTRPEIRDGDFAEVKEGQWLGAVVYSTGKDGQAMACAPRYIQLEHYVKITLRWLLGRCLLLKGDLSGHLNRKWILNPCENEPKSNRDFGYCEAGFSAEYMKDPPYSVIFGAVGSKQWTGAVMMVDPDNPSATPTKTTQDQIDRFEYNGYSIASGIFSVQSSADVVSGAPRGDNIIGKALIYKYESDQFSVRSQLPQPKDLHTGSYFGSVVCAVDLDNNEYADVLVGAPYFTDVLDEGRVYIYLNNGKGILNLQDTVLSGDNKYNAHFGQAIASVGDLNADRFNDVAIGAPMEGEDGSGAVYIYHGSRNGIKLPYSQKIVGSLIQSGIKMFGISVAGNVDVDKNGYPDIVVGAYASNKAVLIRTKSVVSVTIATTLSEEQITVEGNDSTCDLNGKRYKCVNVTVNLKYEDAISSSATSDLHLTFTVDLDKDIDVQLRRTFFYDEVTKSKVVTLRQNTTLGQPNTNYEVLRKTAYIKSKNELGDLTSLLPFDVTLSQPQPPCANNMCPILNDRMATSKRVTIPFAKKCRSRTICEPDLVLSAQAVFNPKSDVLRLGVVKDFTIELTVENKAEDSAYTSRITLKYPEALNYIGANAGVQCDRKSSDNNTQTATCGIGNPLLAKSKKSFGIKFSPGSVKEDFVVQVETSSQDKDASIKDNKKTISVAVKYEADVEITGTTKQDQVVYQGPVRSEEEVKKDLDSIGPEIVQTLSVRNNGPSDLRSSEVFVNFPKAYSSSKPDSFLLYLLLVELDGASGICDASVNPLKIKPRNETATESTPSRRRRDTGNLVLSCRQAACQTFKCQLGQLKAGDKANIKMTFRLWENTLLKELDGPKAVDLVTSARVKVSSDISQSNYENDDTEIKTTARPASTAAQEKKTPWWIISLSVLGGLLLVAAVIVILYKVGFFKRKQIKDISAPDTTEMTVQ
ncbi:integrin alpha-9-like isoform X2 [Acropora muricata]|uniref:integrin alpha-9-like isoform X2 n=1 Tax=Acropora muricata TaxID=159855 RepID=UPI0034E46A68